MPFDWSEAACLMSRCAEEVHFPKDFVNFGVLVIQDMQMELNCSKLYQLVTIQKDENSSFVLLQDHLRFIKNEM